MVLMKINVDYHFYLLLSTYFYNFKFIRNNSSNFISIINRTFWNYCFKYNPSFTMWFTHSTIIFCMLKMSKRM